jgi:cellulose synthase/poly-beta-1,6-N-acetylglucosamine synthase-like glycosyltransferase
MALGGATALARPRSWFGAAADGPTVVAWAAGESDEPTTGAPSPFAEIDCLRASLAPDVLAAAEERATKLGVGADRVLIGSGATSEETYLRALAKYLGVAFEPLEGIPRALCPVGDERLIESAAAGLLPLMPDGDLCLVVAPRGVAARRISGMIERNPQLSRRFRFTSSERLTRFVLHHAGETLAARASDDLKRNWPTLSAAPPRWLSNIVLPALAGLVSLVAFTEAPAATLYGADIVLALVFLAWLGLRLVGASITDRRERGGAPANDSLPTYTVIAALYREATSVDGLLSAIERLDYPPEKLDVIVAVEADDAETRRALAARKGCIPVSVITVPAFGPRTKPKALNVALPFARGTFAVIYDAEDRPEPDQLRRALWRFRGGERVACVQARLCIDNTADSWLSRFFTAEYAGQFDVFLPGIAALGLPVPLGGSSNHFRTACLREIGGWDAYNVTEDADLGMRLARFGYRTGVTSSTTFEEAPAKFGAWLRQRTRWFKGWMQTWLVHMRQPRRLLRELGPAGFLAFQLIVGGNVLAALVHPLFMAGLIYSVANGAPLWHSHEPAVVAMAVLYGTTIAIGYATSAFLGWLGLKRRNLLTTAWVLVLTPLHWLLLSLAAWRGLVQLIVAPYAWEKTEHGLARSSRRAAELTRSLLRLERHLTRAAKSGGLPNVNRRPTNTSSAPPPPRRAAA